MLEKKRTRVSVVAIIAVLVLIFMYLPIATVVIYSFNPDKVNSFPMAGFSFKWFGVLAQDADMIAALGHSLVIAIVGTIIAILLGVPGAYAMYKYNFPGKQLLNRLVMLPLTLPGILTGVALLTFFNVLHIHQGPVAVLLGHATFLIATVLPQVYTRLRHLDMSILEAAEDLGASSVTTFFKVVLPNIQTAIISSALLSFTLSMDEIPVTYFLNGVFTTLPIQIYGMTRNGITPEVNAISSIIFAVSLAAILVSNLLNKEAD